MATSANRKIRLNGGGNVLLNAGGYALINTSDHVIGGVPVGTGSGPNDVLRPKPPSPPADVRAARSADFLSTVLTWLAVAGATGYEIYRALDYRAQPTLVRTEPLLTWTDTGLDLDLNYVYSIRAINATMNINGRRSLGHFVPKKNDVINE